MKKKIFSLVAIAAISLGAWNYSENQNNVELSDLALANVEALAWGEDGGSSSSCFNSISIAPDDGSLAVGARDCWTCQYYWVTYANDSDNC